MSARQNARRGAPPVLNAPPARPALNVEEWESKATLTDREVTSVGLLKPLSEQTPLPYKFTDEDAGSSSRSSTPVGRGLRLDPGRGAGISRPSSPLPPSNSTRLTSATTHALHPKQPVQTPQQFYDWFALIDRSVAHSQEAHFRAHIASVSAHLDTCDRLVERIEEIDGEVDGMLEGWRGVEEGGKNLKDACERLLGERDQLVEMTDEIGARLEYFQELEHATRMLNHPGESLVLQTDFLYMVERVDICIDYLKAHRGFRESEIYLLRFQQCMTRAMTLIRMYFVGSLKALSADVSKRLSEKDVSPTAQAHLLYTRFRSVSAQLSPLLGELERRAAAHPTELAALLTECHSAYFSMRKALLVGRLTEEIRGLDPGRTELLELTRAGCSYLKQLCTDEFALYGAFFSSGEEQLYQYLETLCDYLYDDLRPRILHEPRLTALCEVCTVLQALMVLDVAAPDAESSDDETLNLELEKPRQKGNKGLGQLHISHLLEMVLQDAQTRLFFKAQAVIQSDMRFYVPKPEDLAYPDKLVSTDGGLAFDGKEKASFRELFRGPALERQDTWFPTLQKTVWVLSQLHDFVNPAIFEDIAQEAVSLCRQSLIVASDMIKQRSAGSTAGGTLDGDLFLVRHLLILKEITHNLDLAHRDGGEDFQYGVTDTLATMLNQTTSLLPGALFASLGMPRNEEGIRDARHGIDHDLKRVCEGIISTCASPICAPLHTWIDQIDVHNARRAQVAAENAPLTALEAFQRPAAEKLEREFRAACERDLQGQATRLRLYLADRGDGDRTVEVLLQHVRERIADEYALFRDVVWNMYAGDMREKVLSPADVRVLLERVCGREEEAKPES
ncbi:Sec34-like family-domain-containing protein [Roridomyces roridus]|uniref:Conserved oligomeric Golgi complex subunit 3 n=1 Tax=Roridomyces roridus TaxID=1738132 RepID=A0AAD7C2B6_9AGAR|nr:Sec34-like family-domain-containing protein [Roridomyces roridus]